MTSPFNPYQAPVYDQLPQPTEAGDFDFGEAFKDGYTLTGKYFGTALGVMFLGSLLSVLSMFTVVGYFLAVPVFMWGMIQFVLNVKDERAQLNDLFSGFSSYGKVLGRMLLLVVVAFAGILVAEGPMLIGQFLKIMPLQFAGSLLYLAFCVFVAPRVYFVYFLTVDRDLPVMDALSASWSATRGKTLKVLGLGIVCALVAVSGVIGLVVGLFFTVPMAYVMYASAYRQMFGNQPPPRGW